MISDSGGFGGFDPDYGNFFGGNGIVNPNGGSAGGGGVHQGTPSSPSPAPGATPTEAPQQPTGSTQPLQLGAPGSTNQMPWLQGYQGPYAAPTNQYQNQALGGLSNFVAGGSGTGSAENFLNTLMSGGYLNGNNQNFQDIQDSGQTLKNQQDALALKEIQSHAAAGGVGLSGGELGQEQQYEQGSNAQFQNMMAQLRAANYQNVLGEMGQGASQMAPALAATQLGGMNSLMNAGAVPMNEANQQLLGQYGDFLRQGNQFQQAFEYPDQLALQAGNMGYPGYSQPTYGSSGLQNIGTYLQQLFGANGGGQGILDFANNLLGNNQQGTNTGTAGAAADGIRYDGYGWSDGWPGVSYAGTPSGPSYQNSAYWQNELANDQAAQNQHFAQIGKSSPANTGLSILALLASVMGLGGHGSSGGGGRSGSGGAPSSAGGDIGKALHNLFSPPDSQPVAGQAYSQPVGPGMGAGSPTTGIPGLTQGNSSGTGTGSFADLANSMEPLPSDPLVGSGDPFDPMQAASPAIDNASNGPNISTGGDLTVPEPASSDTENFGDFGNFNDLGGGGEDS